MKKKIRVSILEYGIEKFSQHSCYNGKDLTIQGWKTERACKSHARHWFAKWMPDVEIEWS